MRTFTLLLSLALALPLCAETKLAELSWLTGEWAATIDGLEMEEIWSTPRGGVLIGMHRDISKKRTSFEFMRIAETADGITFFGQPGGKPAVPFRLTQSSAQRVVFANPEHDFPKRVIYRMKDSRLCARVEGDGDAGEEWCWSRVD
ncbi:MAG TPA: DUF6265 family protein [Thermoanaerobaculia bacterium]|nr:DUF6265 family protein [Thermoanaerobaculia bacterium]